jgi:hypothetical protein
MALEGEQRVVAAHAVAVVDDANEFAAASFDLDTNAGGSGVEGVFEELFDYGCGAFDHFTSSDLIGDLIGEYVDLAHGLIVVSLGGKSLTQRARRFRGGRSGGLSKLGE